MEDFAANQYKIEPITAENAGEYQDLLDSTSYISEYSGRGNEGDSAVSEVLNPGIPKEWDIRHHHFRGVLDDSGSKVAWVKYYDGLREGKTIFLGEFFIHRNFQKRGHGRNILSLFEQQWAGDGFENIILNVDLKNWVALRFWIGNGFDKIEKIFGDYEYSDKTYAMLRLKKTIRNQLS